MVSLYFKNSTLLKLSVTELDALKTSTSKNKRLTALSKGAFWDIAIELKNVINIIRSRLMNLWNITSRTCQCGDSGTV